MTLERSRTRQRTLIPERKKPHYTINPFPSENAFIEQWRKEEGWGEDAWDLVYDQFSKVGVEKEELDRMSTERLLNTLIKVANIRQYYQKLLKFMNTDLFSTKQNQLRKEFDITDPQRLVITRAMTVPIGKKINFSNLGEHWSWGFLPTNMADYDTDPHWLWGDDYTFFTSEFEPYLGRHYADEEVMVIATVDRDAVDWGRTILQKMAGEYGVENELFFKRDKDVPIKIVGLYNGSAEGSEILEGVTFPIESSLKKEWLMEVGI
jgi:hypothetical protein